MAQTVNQNAQRQDAGESAMTEAAQCIRKTKVRLFYIPPDSPKEPADCRSARFYKKPEIRYDTDYKKTINGELIQAYYDFICPIISTEGVGSIIAIVQIGVFIEFYVTFRDKAGADVYETHRAVAVNNADRTLYSYSYGENRGDK